MESKNVDDSSKGDMDDKEKETVEKNLKSVCKFYMKKQCKHGIKGENCSFSHPHICQKLLKFGHSNKGCRGNGCKNVHPKMCHHSLKSKECPFENCKFYHVKGTKFVGNMRQESGQTHLEQSEIPSSLYKNQNSFLGPEQSLQSIKAEILETMDIRFATLMSCFQSQCGIQRLPAPNPLQGCLPPQAYPQAQLTQNIRHSPHMLNVSPVREPWKSYAVNSAHQNQVNQSSSQQTQSPQVAHIPQHI